VSDYVNAAGIGKEGSCHMFRHTMATLMPENGAEKKLKEVHAATHPGDRLQPNPTKPSNQ
jgi:integrase